MDKKIFIWLGPLIGVFLLALTVDFYLSNTGKSDVDGSHEEIAAMDFMAAAQAGQMETGRIVYRSNVHPLADLYASRNTGEAAVEVRTTTRLTEADLALLREHRFEETDTAAMARARVPTTRDHVALVAHGASRVLGLALAIAAAILIVRHFMGQSTAFSGRPLRPTTSPIRFEAVAGCNEAKEEVSEIVEFLKDPTRFRSTGGRMPKGVLLVGPPGTGKTMLAKAVAGEAQANFYSLSGSDFVELYVGVGAARVRSLFKKARETAPSIIFIDEIDAVGRTRASGEAGGGAGQEHDQTLNALLVAMDGFDSDDAVVVFGATNRPETIDRALMRPGRFDRQVSVALPDLPGRVEILKVHAARVSLDPSVDLQEIAKSTSGFSGADLANLVNEGALHAARNRRPTILMSDLDEARDKISWGRENRRVMTDQDKKIIAYHEAGHALMQVLSADDALKLHKVTIIPRGQSLGSTHFMPQRDLLNYSQEQLEARLQCLMAGRIAEELAIGSITSGASGDIQEASRIARQMVFEWGMSPLGFLAISRPQGGEPLASQQTFHEAESHVKALLDRLYRATTESLKARREALDAIATALIEQETVSGDAVRTLVDGGPADPVTPSRSAPLAA